MSVNLELCPKLSTDKRCISDKKNRNLHLPLAISELYFSPILTARKLTEGPDVKRVYEITLTTKQVNHDFDPGDTIGILPYNDDKIIEKLLIRLGLDNIADDIYEVKISTNCKKKNYVLPKHIPQVTTIRNIFLGCVDINSPPKKLFLKSLVAYCSDNSDIEKLQHLCSPQGSEEYIRIISNECCSLLGLLECFSSCKPSIETLIEHLPPLQPRPYSISSSPLEKDSLQITFFVAERGNGTSGVCTGWLEKQILQFNDEQTEVEIPFYFRKSHDFTLPVEPSVPIIMVATGTGIAPFKGFLEHRFLQKNTSGTAFGNTWLFFGCRYIRRDFLYKDELDKYLRSRALNRLHVAFSREFRNKVHVQLKIEEYGAELVEVILKYNGVIYVCGDAKTMMKDVKNAVETILVKRAHLTQKDAEDYVDTMIKNKRYITDVWS